MLGNVLVPLDGSELAEQVLAPVEALARGLGAPVTLVHAIETPPLPSSLERAHRRTFDQMVDKELSRAEAYLQGILERLRPQGLTVSYQVLIGTPPEAIASYAQSHGVELVAMCTHGRSGLERWLMGSVADKVLRVLISPLLLLRPREGRGPTSFAIQKLLVPLDGSELAEQALPVAEHLSRTLDVPLLLLRSVPTLTFAFSDPYPYGGAEFSAEVWEAMEKEAEEYLATVTKGLQQKGLKVETSAPRGDPGMHITDLAGKTRGSLVVMSTHGRSGLGRWVLGSVADKVVRSSGSPVLLVRSEGGAP